MRAMLLLAFAVLLTGCADLLGLDTRRSGASSSLVDYLYPEGQVPPEFDERVPRLDLPLRVGLAFVPAGSGGFQAPVLPEADKARLLERVRAGFTDRKYISSIEIIPETYLRSTRGFDGVEQVARLYGVDVMALVSYDQVAAVDDRPLSVTYWTIVGAYFIRGTGNEVNTFVDTAVFDMGSRRLLLRAPGVDQRERTTTAVGAARTLREIRAESFEAAVEAMTTNLAVELDRFEQRLKDEPQLADVSWRDGRSGGSALGPLSLLALAGLAGWQRRRVRRPAPLCN